MPTTPCSSMPTWLRPRSQQRWERGRRREGEGGRRRGREREGGREGGGREGEGHGGTHGRTDGGREVGREGGRGKGVEVCVSRFAVLAKKSTWVILAPTPPACSALPCPTPLCPSSMPRLSAARGAAVKPASESRPSSAHAPVPPHLRPFSHVSALSRTHVCTNAREGARAHAREGILAMRSTRESNKP